MTHKLLLAAIAIGLFVNAAATLVRPARADGVACQSLVDVNTELSSIASSLRNIDSHFFHQTISPNP